MKIRLCLLTLFAASQWALGQEIGDYISKYTAENGKGYMQPLADVFGADLNSGLFQGSKLSPAGFHLTIGVKGVMARIGDDMRTFKATTEEPFSPTQTATVPTIFGKDEAVSVTGVGGTVYNFPGGFDMDMMPLVIPQATIGTLLGTEATVRYFMANLGDDIGDLKLAGIGVRHSISQYLPLLPIDLSVGYFTQKFSVGEVVEAQAVYYGAQVGKTLGILCLYGGAGYESTEVTVTYDQEKDVKSSRVSFDMKSEDQLRFTVGVGLNLVFLKIHADYNIASQKTLCAGIGFGW